MRHFTPDQIAVHTGWISQVGQQSICLPHKLLIEIKPAQAGTGTSGDTGGWFTHNESRAVTGLLSAGDGLYVMKVVEKCLQDDEFSW